MLEVTVTGTPVPQGSHKGFFNQKTQRVQITNDNPETSNWRDRVCQAAVYALDGRLPLNGPVEVTIAFIFARPKGHFGTGRNADVLKEWAPSYKESRPDIDKLARAILDALTEARVWKDDGQVAALNLVKGYAIDPQKPGAQITVVPLAAADLVTAAAAGDGSEQGALI